MDNTTSAPPAASSTISENIKGKDAEHCEDTRLTHEFSWTVCRVSGFVWFPKTPHGRKFEAKWKKIFDKEGKADATTKESQVVKIKTHLLTKQRPHLADRWSVGSRLFPGE
jgi:hypothetical protein